MRLGLLSLTWVIATTMMAQSSYDAMAPVGFASHNSRTSTSSTYSVTGGGCAVYPVTGVSNVITLTSTGSDQRKAIQDAIKNNSVIVFDGSAGDFILSSRIDFSSLSGKTLLGINGARLCTQWYVTAADKAALDAANVKSASTSAGTGGTLSNGSSVSEQREFLTRQILLGRYGNENYRNAGIFNFSSCTNIIIRNIQFVGPGPVDVGGSDLVSLSGCKHFWIDHCDFTDGMDGNMDITNSSDFNTVSWCTFSYTARAYDHMNSNLVGASDSDGAGKLNTTFICNHWGAGCNQRMPMARSGKIHMLNNYYTCSNNGSSINPRKNSEFLIVGNYFASSVTTVFSQTDATAYVWDASNIVKKSSARGQIPSNKGTVTMPYPAISAMPADSVPTHVGRWAGATIDWERLTNNDNENENENDNENQNGSASDTICISLTVDPTAPTGWERMVITTNTEDASFLTADEAAVLEAANSNSADEGFNMGRNANYILLDLTAYPDRYIESVSFDVRIPRMDSTKKTYSITLGSNNAQSYSVSSTEWEHRTIATNSTNIRTFRFQRTAGTRTVLRNLCLVMGPHTVPTDISHAQQHTATKCLIDGKLYILRGSHCYHMTGAVIR